MTNEIQKFLATNKGKEKRRRPRHRGDGGAGVESGVGYGHRQHREPDGSLPEGASVKVGTFFLSVLILTTAVQAGSPEAPATQWRACKENSDCVLVEDHCGGATSINKTFLEQHKEWLGKIRPVIFCQNFIAGQWPEGATAICRESQCAVKTTTPAKRK